MGYITKNFARALEQQPLLPSPMKVLETLQAAGAKKAQGLCFILVGDDFEIIPRGGMILHARGMMGYGRCSAVCHSRQTVATKKG